MAYTPEDIFYITKPIDQKYPFYPSSAEGDMARKLIVNSGIAQDPQYKGQITDKTPYQSVIKSILSRPEYNPEDVSPYYTDKPDLSQQGAWGVGDTQRLNLASTTEDWVASNPLTEGLGSSVISRPQAQNANQKGEKGKNALVSSFEAVQELMQGGKTIPRSLVEPEEGSGKTSGLNLAQYNRVERDIRGNIIGLSGRMQFDPVSGAPTGKIAPDWSAEKQGVSKTGEAGPQESEISKANRQAYLQSKQQQGANVVAGIKAGREAAGFNPETGVWSPREQGMPNTYEMKNAALKQTALNKSIEQGFGDKTNIYGQAYQGMPTQGKTIFGEHGYVQSYPASQSSTTSSRAVTKGLTEAELKKAKQQQA